MKKKIYVIALLGYSIFVLGGCASVSSLLKTKKQVENAVGAPVLPRYSGPKARISLADFEIKAVKAQAEDGLGLRDTLIATLINSSRFLVVERQAQNVDLIITAAVTEFEPQASGGNAGLAGGGGPDSGAFGGLLGASLNKAHMALDIKIVDAATSRVLAAKIVQGQAQEMSKAIRICITEAVRYISQVTPGKYYKY